MKILMLILALVVAGMASYLQLGVDRLPSMDMPTVYVRTSYPGMSPQEMESEISRILEDAVATVEGIDELRSISGEGTSFVIITFNFDRNLDAAAQDVRDAIGAVLNQLPRDTDPPVIEKQAQMQDAVNALMEQVRGGDLSPQEALDQAKTEIEALLA